MEREYIVVEYDVNGIKDTFAYCKNKNELLWAIDNIVEEGILEFQVRRKMVPIRQDQNLT